MKKWRRGVLNLLLGIASVFAATPGFATNGMNLEGYGPIATGMGGASMAYDNGDAALMNNPATLALMPQGNRLDIALGYLGPHVKAACEAGPCAGQSVSSTGNAYFMPAFGLIQKDGPISFGVGMFAQGGMGTEYSKDSFMAWGSGERVRSEVSVGRLLFPFAYEINKNISVAATLDYVWAGMDLKMAMGAAQFGDLITTQQFGTASGPLVTSFQNFMGMGMTLNYARFDFSDDSDFTGAATGTGFAGKLGGVFRVNKDLTIGAAYHSKTMLDDLREGSKGKMSTSANFGVMTNIPIVLQGEIKVKNFEWPQTAGVGAAYQVSPRLLVVADYKWINWKDVMKDFRVTFTSDQSAANDYSGAFGPDGDLRGKSIDTTLYQKWKDQHVIMIGAGYNVAPDWTVRAGLNYANNPIPASYLNALFPAIETSHVTTGVGYQVTKAASADISFTYAPEVEQKADSGVTSTHSQTNSQVMFSYRY